MIRGTVMVNAVVAVIGIVIVKVVAGLGSRLGFAVRIVMQFWRIKCGCGY